MNTITDKKQHLLHTGMAVIFRQGYNATGVQDIVDAAGMPKGSFYNYFASKEAFVVEGVCAISQQAQACSRAQLQAEGVAPLQRVIGFFEAGVVHMRDSGFSGGCLVGNLCQEMADSSELVRDKVDALMAGHIRQLRDCFAEAQERGELPANRDPQDTAEFVFYAWEGALMRMKASKSEAPLQAFLRVLRAVCLNEAAAA